MSPTRIAFLTMAETKVSHPDDDLALAPLRSLGMEGVMVDWRAPLSDWSGIELAVLRSTYDYIHSPVEFCRFLEGLRAKNVAVANPVEVVFWNHNKTYLLELIDKGIPVIPSHLMEGWDGPLLKGLAHSWQTDTLILKPLVGATAHGIRKVGAKDFHGEVRDRGNLESSEKVLVQPFLPQVEKEGEFSLFFFNRRFSHAVLKKPKPGDFRVQQEFGGGYCSVQVPTAAVKVAEQVLSAVAMPLLYARVDLVRTGKGFHLMECELIEPQLFLGSDSLAPERFAAAIEQAVAQQTFKQL